MLKIIIDEDCGNSPKNILLQDLTIAMVKGDLKFIRAIVTDNIQWNIVGDQVIRDKDNFVAVLGQINDQAEELSIRHVATHGKAGAVDGTIRSKNGKTLAFCHVFEFGNAKGTSVKEITSYLLVVK